MKFPKAIRHRKAECKIYGKKPDYPFYRVAWYVTGQRRVKQFATYSKAKEFADALVKDLAKGSPTTALAPTQATDALAVVDRLKAFYQHTGRNVSLLRAVSEYVEAAGKLSGHTVPTFDPHSLGESSSYFGDDSAIRLNYVPGKSGGIQ